MSHTAEDLLIIYQTEAEQWATYLKSAFTGPIPEAGICCYNIATMSSRRDDFLRLAGYSCKILILSKGMLDGLSQLWRFFLARVLSPAAQVVVLLCGVDSLTPLLELVPLNGDECLQISSEQDAHEYLSTVTDIVRKGVSARAANINPLTRKPFGSVQSIGCRAVVVPSRVPCRTSMEVFILLENEAPGGDTEVEFAGEYQTLRVKPVHWNDRALCVNAPDFPAGTVRVTVYINGVPLSKAELQYYSSMEELACLLARVADPVDFMCQALQVPSVDKLDDKLSSMLLEAMPSGGFPARQCYNTPERELHHAGSPTLLHFAAQYGLMGVSSLLLQCPGADRALQTTNQHVQTPAEIARSHGHAELEALLRKTMNISNPGEENADSGVQEVMCAAGSPSTADMQKEEGGEDEQEEMEDIYTSLGMNDEYDTFMNPKKAVVIANRPPAPTPRPESITVVEDTVSYITQVFKKKKTPQGNAELYSLPTKEARGREPSISSTYDNLVEMHGIEQLAGLKQRVKAGSLTVDEALERFSDWQRAQKGMDADQKEKLTQLRDVMIKSSEDDDSVYDQIHIVHHAPSNTQKENRRASVPLESGVYSKPLKQHHSHFFRRPNKR
ncbi:unnamed protein product [Pleuronectes platessa]|uniref:DBB domain-containing protein n=1 Tax=Pleuronectes platessa TaxID=8262 RepID=A0A9N7Z897_PLEPL|nr:unnamed protein product [Pleuronectes platessa]